MVDPPSPRPRQRPVDGVLAVAAAVLLLAFALPLPQHGAILGLPSICGFHYLFGMPCPGCGLTRAFVCCAHGHLTEAFLYHPLGPPLFAITVLFALTTPWRGSLRPTQRHQRLFWVALAAALAVTWVVRLDGFFPLPP